MLILVLWSSDVIMSKEEKYVTSGSTQPRPGMVKVPPIYLTMMTSILADLIKLTVFNAILIFLSDQIELNQGKKLVYDLSCKYVENMRQ